MTDYEKQLRIKLNAVVKQINNILGEDKLDAYIDAIGYDHSEKYVAQYENKQNKSTHEQEVYAESKFIEARKTEIRNTYDSLSSRKARFDDLYNNLVAAHKNIKTHKGDIAQLEAEEAATKNDRTDTKNEIKGKIDDQEKIINENLLALNQDLEAAESILTKFEKLNNKDNLKEELDKFIDSVKKRPEYVEKKAQEEALAEEARREYQKHLEEQKAKAEQAAKEAAERAEAERKRKAEEEHKLEGEELKMATNHYGDPYYELSKELLSKSNRYIQENSKNSKLNEAINAYKEIRVKEINASIKADIRRERVQDTKSLDNNMNEGKNLVQRFFPENIPNLRDRVDKINEFRDYVGTNPDVLDIDRHSARLDQFTKMITVANQVAKLHHQTPRPGFFSRLFNTSYNKAYNREQAALDYFKDKLSRLDSDYVEKITGSGTCNEELDKDEMLDAFYDMQKSEKRPNDIRQISQSDVRMTAERDVKIALADALHNNKNPLETFNQYVKDNSALANDQRQKTTIKEAAKSITEQHYDKDGAVKNAPTKVNEKSM